MVGRRVVAGVMLLHLDLASEDGNEVGKTSEDVTVHSDGVGMAICSSRFTGVLAVISMRL